MQSYSLLIWLFERRLCVAMDLSYTSKEKIDEINLLIKELSNKLNALSKSYANKQSTNNQINSRRLPRLLISGGYG